MLAVLAQGDEHGLVLQDQGNVHSFGQGGLNGLRGRVVGGGKDEIQSADRFGGDIGDDVGGDGAVGAWCG